MTVASVLLWWICT